MRDFRKAGLECGSRDRDGDKEQEYSTLEEQADLLPFWAMPTWFLFVTERRFYTGQSGERGIASSR